MRSEYSKWLQAQLVAAQQAAESGDGSDPQSHDHTEPEHELIPPSQQFLAEPKPSGGTDGGEGEQAVPPQYVEEQSHDDEHPKCPPWMKLATFGKVFDE